MSPVPVGVISRSGGMTTETAWMVKKAGLGCSTCISCGGDYLIGATFADLAIRFEHDPETQAIIIFCEPGAHYEVELADAVAQGLVTKPIIAYIAGSFTAKIKSEAKFGHAGAILDKDCSATAIENRFNEVGIHVAKEYDDIIPLLKSKSPQRHELTEREKDMDAQKNNCRCTALPSPRLLPKMC